MAFVRALLSYLTGLQWFNWFVAYILFIATTLAFNITMFTLTKRLTSDDVTAIISIIIGALSYYR